MFVRVSWYSELLSVGILQPLNSLIEGQRNSDGSQNYVTPLGMSSVVKHFLSESGTGPPVCSSTCLPVLLAG